MVLRSQKEHQPLIHFGNKDNNFHSFVSYLTIQSFLLCQSYLPLPLSLYSTLPHSLGISCSKISDLERRGYILTKQTGLNFDLEQPKIEIQLNISQNNDTSSFNNGFAPNRVWFEILRNSSSVYLHTLILRDDAKDLDEITSKVLNVRTTQPRLALTLLIRVALVNMEWFR